MKILYFHQHFSTPQGSSGTRSYEMAKKLVARGHDVTMVCGSYVGSNIELQTVFKKAVRRGRIDSIDIIEFELPYSNKQSFMKRARIFISYAFKSTRLVFTEEYDMVFATTTPLTAGIPGIFARWFKAKPFIFEVRDLWPELPREMGVIKNPIILGLMSILEWVSYKSANALIGLSPGIKQGIERLNIAKENVRLIPNGCDLTIFNSTDKTIWLPDGIEKGDFIAIYTGTHGMANGLDAVIDVAEELKSRNRNDIKFVLVGQGKLKQQLIEQANAKQLDNIIFNDPVNKQKLSQLMRGADVGLQLLANIPAFYYGTSPNKFFDYISAGLPVLNNYPGWLKDMINETGCGIAIDPESSQDFADALEKMADHRDILPEMSVAALTLAKDQFDRDKLSDSFVQWLEEKGQK